MAVDDLRWADKAACKGADPEWFFSTEYEETEKAYALCANCPVKFLCLEYAVNDPSITGIWGGTSWRKRNQIRRLRKLRNDYATTYRQEEW